MESSPKILVWVLIAACLGSGIMAGLFSAFSTFIMKALSSLSDPEGIKAMQAINRHIVRPSFLIVFLGTGLLCIAAVVLGMGDAPGAAQTISATLIYILACILSTIVFNVPLNNHLDTVDPEAAESHQLWVRYLSLWTKWNHLRAIATIASTILLASAIASL